MLYVSRQIGLGCLAFTATLLTVFLVDGVSHGQEPINISPEAPPTQLEAFLGKKGSILLKQFDDVGSLKCMFSTIATFKAVQILEPNSGITTKGMRVEIKSERDRVGRSGTAFLDVEELQSLSQAIDYFHTLAENWSKEPRPSREAVFVTKGEFRIGFSQEGAKLTAFARVGSPVVEHCFIPMNSLLTVKEFVGEGGSVLK